MTEPAQSVFCCMVYVRKSIYNFYNKTVSVILVGYDDDHLYVFLELLDEFTKEMS